MGLSNQLAAAVQESEDSGFFTPASFKAAVAHIPKRLQDASGTPWEAKKTDGPAQHKIQGGMEMYVNQKWYPKDKKLPMGCELNVTQSASGKIFAEFRIEKNLKAISSEEKESDDLKAITAWIQNLVSDE